VSSVTGWAQEVLELEQVWCRTVPGNERASALFTALGWTRLGDADGRTIWST
jgi:RimJ/RimL family protein N-acetyltransferase